MCILYIMLYVIPLCIWYISYVYEYILLRKYYYATILLSVIILTPLLYTYIYIYRCIYDETL